ncbi:fucose isomerase, partial [mine drainage metagenome]
MGPSGLARCSWRRWERPTVRKAFPPSIFYGRDVRDADDTAIPEDVQQKLLQFARAALAVAAMRGRSYCSIGGVSMGIAGSAVDSAFFETYLGMRVMNVDMTELTRRIDRKIYDPKELAHALKWTKANGPEGLDANSASRRRNRAQKNKEWEHCVKMALIVRDLMIGNPQLEQLGFGEEALGHNAIAAGFQGQRQWTDHYPNGDFLETILNSSFDWNGIRQPFIVATENDALNGATMLFGHLLTGS